MASTKELVARAKEMRLAIDLMEGAMMNWTDLLDLKERCALDESDADDIELEVTVTWGELRRVLTALEELTRIINSEDYVV